MKKTIMALILLLPFFIRAQQQEKGIQWTRELSWDRVKQKAKAENKYIFLDCYTTWCVPCKRMDEEVYVDDSVGKYMNEKFINVKVQMNKTKNDDEEIISWYKDASSIQYEYRVTAYPTYLFFKPDGQIVHRDGAYAGPAKFLELVAKAFDSKAQYYTLKAEYERGKKDYTRVQYLIGEGRKMRDYEFVNKLQQDYLNHLSKKQMKEIFTKTNLEFIASAVPDTRSQWFDLFYKKEKRVNKVMEQSGFAKRTVDSAIARQYINPVLRRYDFKESPNWQQMQDSIGDYFGDETARRLITRSKVRWYQKKKDKTGSRKDEATYRQLFIDFYDMGGMDTSYLYTDFDINLFAYASVFKNQKWENKEETKMVNAAIKMMEGVVRRSDKVLILENESHERNVEFTKRWKAMKIDTYACLLYKAGRQEEAIKWQEEALKIAILINDAKVKDLENTLAAMKSNTLIKR
jgi:thioredoxin-related protein